MPAPKAFEKWMLLLLFGFLWDFGVVATLYGSLPNPQKLIRGVKIERTASDGSIFSFVAGPKNRHYVTLDHIPSILQSAIIYLEDGKFYFHRGFDLEEMANAIWSAIYSHNRLRGASTISQQLVKNLYLSPERSFRRKIVEALITIKLEFFLSKPKILELYLNSIDWGQGLFGISEAAWHYFHKAPEELNVKESVFLAAIVPNPSRFGRLDDELLIPKRFARRQMVRALDYLYHTNQISIEEYRGAIEFAGPAHE